MNCISLFSGIGGIDLAAQWAGFKTVLFCEQDDYCQRVLNRHWPNVPIIKDVRDVSRATLDQHGIADVTLLTGGFPCQPFSDAGKRRGEADDRYLWPEMLRVVAECKPTWFLGENVPGIINLALDKVCADLEGEGYEVIPTVLPACGVGAPHRRSRVFIVGYYERERSRSFSHVAHTACQLSYGSGGAWRGGVNLQTAVLLPTPRANKIGGYSSKGYRPTLAQAINMWPTPDAGAGVRGAQIERKDQRHHFTLNDAVKMWPTPTARDHKDGTSIGSAQVNGLRGRAVGPSPESGSLNPQFVEYLMGFPNGWTVLEP